MSTIVIQDCEQLTLDNDWSLTRTNSCHIGNMNSEMGALAKAQQDMLMKMEGMCLKVDFMIWLWGAVAIAIIALVIKKMWGK